MMTKYKELDSYQLKLAITDDNFKIISAELISLLKDNKVTATIAGREKTPFSIWRKMQNKKISLEQLTDIVGFRILLNSVEDCYKTLGILHSKYSYCIIFKFLFRFNFENFSQDKFSDTKMESQGLIFCFFS